MLTVGMLELAQGGPARAGLSRLCKPCKLRHGQMNCHRLDMCTAHDLNGTTNLLGVTWPEPHGVTSSELFNNKC